jgi:hypothetical protein
VSDLNLTTAPRAIVAIAAFEYWYDYDFAHERFHGQATAKTTNSSTSAPLCEVTDVSCRFVDRHARPAERHANKSRPASADPA